MNQETKTCQNCQINFDITDEDQKFYDKMKVPTPKLCSDCRMKRKLVSRNETTLYKRQCDLCKESIISMYNPQSPYIVYCEDCYNSDKWDRNAYGRDYDLSKPFFEQLQELTKKVPKKGVYTTLTNVNSKYQNFAGGSKDCYLVFNSGLNEKCSYSRGLKNCKDSLDNYFAVKLEKSYECINGQHSYGMRYSQNVISCLNSWFLLNCSNLQDCFGCVNLRNKNYHFLNKPLSGEEYNKKISEIVGSYDNIQKFLQEFEQFKLGYPRRQNNNIKAIDCEGEYIFQSKNCKDCFETADAEDCKFHFSTKVIKDSYDVMGYGYDSELLLEAVAVGYSYNMIASWGCDSCRDIQYCFGMEKAEDCFGCDGLNNVKYRILNKEYSKDEYVELRDKIINQMKESGDYGLYFPPEITFFAYNETVAQEYFPSNKEEVLKQGFRWEDNIPHTYNKETMQPDEIPDNIKDVPDSIIKETLKCVECEKNYRLIKSELEFYKAMLIPVPRKCFSCRHLDRVRRRGPFKLYSHNCSLCKKSIKTTYSPDAPEKVYCEKCYQNEVV